MSATTIEIPAAQVDAIRESLLRRRDDAERSDEIDDLIAQLDGGAPGAAGPCTLLGSRMALWNAVYDSLCAGAEQLAEECNEYWRGPLRVDAARAAVADVGARLELLIALGAPPGS